MFVRNGHCLLVGLNTKKKVQLGWVWPGEGGEGGYRQGGGADVTLSAIVLIGGQNKREDTQTQKRSFYRCLTE